MAKTKHGKQSDSLSHVPTQFIPCRAWEHDWRHITDRVTRNLVNKVVAFTRVTRCRTCRLEREQDIDLPGFGIKRRRYFYPDGFQVKGGAKKWECRAEYFHRSGLEIASGINEITGAK